MFSKLLEHRNTDLDSSMLKDLLFLKAEQWLSRGNLLFADLLMNWNPELFLVLTAGLFIKRNSSDLEDIHTDRRRKDVINIYDCQGRLY